MFEFLLRNLDYGIVALIFGAGILRWIATKLGRVGARAAEMRQRLERGEQPDEFGKFADLDSGRNEVQDDDGEWEIIEPFHDQDPIRVQVETARLPEGVMPPAQMTVSELRDHSRSLESASGVTATWMRPTQPPPAPESAGRSTDRHGAGPRPQVTERVLGNELVHTSSTKAYDIAVDAYKVDTDSFAPRISRRRHSLVRRVDRTALRRAILWREILDPPLSLRNGPPGVNI